MFTIGQDVKVYRNLRNKMLSVRHSKTERVIGYASHIVLTDVTFIVRQGGRNKVIETGQKNVHAMVRGTVAETIPDDELIAFMRDADVRRVMYNPYHLSSFMSIDPIRGDLNEINEADMVYIRADGRMYAKLKNYEERL